MCDCVFALILRFVFSRADLSEAAQWRTLSVKPADGT